MPRIQAHFKRSVKRTLSVVGDNSDMTLGERIKRRRKEIGVTVAAVAKAAGVSVQAVYAWEKGDTKRLKAEPLVGLIEILKVTPRWLVFGNLPKEQIPPKITDDEWRLVKAYRKAPDAVKSVMQAGASPYVDEEENNAPNRRPA